MEWNAAGVSTQQAASIGGIQVLRATTHFVALLIASTGALLAYVASVLAYGAFGVVIAAVLVLLVHQPIRAMTVESVIFLALAFIAPSAFVHVTYNTAACRGSTTPCDPAPNNRLGLLLVLTAILLGAALVTAAVGCVRSSRLTHAPRRRIRRLA